MMRVVFWLRCDVGVDRAIVRDAGGRVFVARCRRLRLGGGRAGVLWWMSVVVGSVFGKEVVYSTCGVWEVIWRWMSMCAGWWS